MKKWLGFAALLAVAGVSLWLGVRPEAGFNHGWLSLALAAVFFASDARYWATSAGKA